MCAPILERLTPGVAFSPGAGNTPPVEVKDSYCSRRKSHGQPERQQVHLSKVYVLPEQGRTADMRAGSADKRWELSWITHPRKDNPVMRLWSPCYLGRDKQIPEDGWPTSPTVSKFHTWERSDLKQVNGFHTGTCTYTQAHTFLYAKMYGYWSGQI